MASYINYYIQVVIAMANINNTSSYMDEDKKQIIKESNYTYRDALEVSAYLTTYLLNLTIFR